VNFLLAGDFVIKTKWEFLVALQQSDDTIRSDTIEEFNVDSKAEYTA